MVNSDNASDESQIRKFLRSEASTYWAFGMTIVTVIVSVGVPFYSLKTKVKILENELEYSNTIARNHLSEIESDLKEIKKRSQENRKRLEEVSLDIQEIKTLIEDTY